MPAKKPVTLLSNYFNAPGDTGSLESAGGDTVPATVAGIPQKRPNSERESSICGIPRFYLCSHLGT